MKLMFYLVSFSESLIFIQPLSYLILDPAFQETTQKLLADISSAHGHLTPILPLTKLSTMNLQPLTSTSTISDPIMYVVLNRLSCYPSTSLLW